MHGAGSGRRGGASGTPHSLAYTAVPDRCTTSTVPRRSSVPTLRQRRRKARMGDGGWRGGGSPPLTHGVGWRWFSHAGGGGAPSKKTRETMLPKARFSSPHALHGKGPSFSFVAVHFLPQREFRKDIPRRVQSAVWKKGAGKSGVEVEVLPQGGGN